MIIETGTVVAVEADGLWVDTIQKTACEACVAQKGCGTAVLSKLTGRTSRLRVLRSQDSTQTYRVGQEVTIAIPEDVVVLASVCAYLVPLGASLIGLWLMSSSDALSILGAVLGLAAGGGLVSMLNAKLRNDPRFNPVLFQVNSVHESLSLS